jgi:HK97 family phage prohead protease
MNIKQTPQAERRIFDVRELRVAKDGKRTIEGHAAVFNKNSAPMWGFVEQVAKGAFTRSIKEDDVRALFNHDPNLILGRNTAGTLRLAEDDEGLAVEIDPPDTQVARDLLVSLERGDISQMSFGFYTRKDEWTYDEAGGLATRTLLDCQLFDVSPVTFPAYPDTDVAVRSLELWKVDHPEKRAAANVGSVDIARRRLQLALAQ